MRAKQDNMAPCNKAHVSDSAVKHVRAEVSAGRISGLDGLPKVPEITFDEMEIAFAGCANLCVYMWLDSR